MVSRLAALQVVVLACGAFAGCAPQSEPSAGSVTVAPSQTPTGEKGPEVKPTEPTSVAPRASLSSSSETVDVTDRARDVAPKPITDAFAEGFSKVQSRLSGPASVTVVPVGGGSSLSTGDLTTGVAWSTSKVPLAIAAQRSNDSASVRRDVRIAIRNSDNSSAERLWAGLGGGEHAASAVEAVLSDAGDETTEVPPVKTRPPYTAFGQTAWDTRQAATFAANLPCIRESSDVLAHMRSVGRNQQWGFWSIPGSAVKGGWGPVGNGYLVRQIAVVPAGDGYAGVAALVQARSFEAGQRDLDTIATITADYLKSMGGNCG